jgi:putative SbcD/Mre11-related phosphoesterase
VDSFEILPGYHAVGLTLHMPEFETSAFSDVHLGFEQALNKHGVLVPPFQYSQVTSHLKEAVAMAKPKRIVINGDLKHEFGSISPQEWAEVLMFLDGLRKYEVVLVRGNHDTILGPIAVRREIRVVEELRLGTTLFVHGDKEPVELGGVRTVVIGHEHPCIGLAEEGRVERVKCFLVGKWKGKNLIVLPSLNFVTDGTDVLQERLLSPLLDEVGDFKAFGVDDGRVMEFGRVRDIATG